MEPFTNTMPDHPFLALFAIGSFAFCAAAFWSMLRWLDAHKGPQIFSQGTEQEAIREFWVRKNYVPFEWTEHQKLAVIRLIRDERKSPREVARLSGLALQDIRNIRYAVHAPMRVISGNNTGRKWWKTIVRNAEGAIIVEFALIAPVLLLLILGGFQFAFALHQYNVMSFAASAAAKCGAEADRLCDDDPHTLGYAQFLAGYVDASFELFHFPCGVQVNGHIRSDLIPNLSWLPFIDLTVQACYPEGKPMSVSDLGNCNVAIYGKTRTVKDAINPVWGDPVQLGGDAMVQVICARTKGFGSSDQWLVN